QIFQMAGRELFGVVLNKADQAMLAEHLGQLVHGGSRHAESSPAIKRITPARTSLALRRSVPGSESADGRPGGGAWTIGISGADQSKNAEMGQAQSGGRRTSPTSAVDSRGAFPVPITLGHRVPTRSLDAASTPPLRKGHLLFQTSRGAA